ncbi:MAG: protease modulator HflK N-terminal domain-containing protein, partial [Burkholderiales bacterium]
MGWNEPPGNKGGRDPWGGRGDGDGPPDLEDIIRRMQEGFGGLFGRKPSIGGRDRSPLFWLLGLLIILALLLFDITYFIDQQERGIVLRLGRYERTL